MEQKKILYIQPLHPAGMELLRERFQVVVAPDESRAVLERLILDADAVVTRLTPVDAGLIQLGARLKAIAKHGVGVDNIDVEAATRRGIAVLTTGNANSLSVAEHTILAIGALFKRIPMLDRAMRGCDWGARDLPGAGDLSGKRLGLVGLGKIGGEVARIAREGFRMEVRAYDPYVRSSPHASVTGDLDGLCAWADVLSLHLPLTGESRDLIDMRRLRLMKSTAYLVNFARGGIVNENHLARALEEGIIAGAALDAFSQEPPDWSHPLLQMDNVILSPHCATFSEDSRIRMSLQVAEGIADVLSGRTPKFAANKEALYSNS